MKRVKFSRVGHFAAVILVELTSFCSPSCFVDHWHLAENLFTLASLNLRIKCVLFLDELNFWFQCYLIK